MRANISDELIEAIDDKIYLDLEIHVLNKRLNEAEKNHNANLVNYLRTVINIVTQNKKQVNNYLKENNVKIDEPIEIDDMFVEYKYYQKVNGGYKEGSNRYWRAAIKYALKKRINKHFGGE